MKADTATGIANSRAHPWLASLGALALIAFFGWLDWQIRPDTSVFYFIPVALATWFGNTRAGLLATAASFLAAWLGESALIGISIPNESFALWNALARFLALLPLVFLLGLLQDELHRARMHARTDFTTDLDNARAFAEAAERELSRARRTGRPLTVAFIDLDHFKAVNDRYGHSAGNNLLRIIARLLQNHTRITDSIGRLGGDEFGILLPETNGTQARAAIEKLQSLLRNAMRERGLPVTFSVGVVTFHSPPPSADALIGAADACMYAVKSTSRDGAHYETRD